MELWRTHIRQQAPTQLSSKPFPAGIGGSPSSHQDVRTSTIELAKREGLNDSYVRRLVRLAFLSPTIIEAICAGWQPADLTAQELTRGADVPLGWSDQQRALGIE